MRQRPLTWLGVGTIAAILAATALATFVSVGAERDDAHDRRRDVTALVVSELAGGVDAATASVEGMRNVIEASGGLSTPAFQHVAAVPLARQPALTGFTWSRLPAGAARRPPPTPSSPREEVPGPAGTPCHSPRCGRPPPRRATTAPRA